MVNDKVTEMQTTEVLMDLPDSRRCAARTLAATSSSIEL